MCPLRQSSVSLKAKITTQLRCGWEMFGFGKLGLSFTNVEPVKRVTRAGESTRSLASYSELDLTLVQVMGKKGNTVNHDGPITSVEVQSLWCSSIRSFVHPSMQSRPAFFERGLDSTWVAPFAQLLRFLSHVKAIATYVRSPETWRSVSCIRTVWRMAYGVWRRSSLMSPLRDIVVLCCCHERVTVCTRTFAALEGAFWV